MKKLTFLILFALALTSCDKIKKPSQKTIGACTLNQAVTKTNAGAGLNTRKVLLEDYTGHTCGFCPRAARKAETLVTTYGNNLVVVAIHAGSQFSPPVSDTLYREDFRSSTGTEWDVFFGMSSAGLPRGGVNRASSPYAQADASWTALVSTALAKPQSAKLEMQTVYDTVQHLLNVKVKTTFLQAFNTNVKLSVILTEDEIVGDQKDYVPPAGSTVIHGDVRPDYLFEHLLIGSVNGTWGQLVKASPAVNDTATVSNECFLLNKCYYKNIVCVDDKHVNVVAFVYRDDTKEVLQVEKMKIR